MTAATDILRWFGVPGVVALLCLVAFLLALGWYALRARTFRMTLVVSGLACVAWTAGWWNARTLAEVEIDDSARLEAEAEARRQRLAAAVETRREQAPGIRFAEDTDVDVLDLAGTSGPRSSEEEALLEEATPAYRRRGPQIRRLTSDADDIQTRGVDIDADAAAGLEAVRKMEAIRRLPPEELDRAEDLSAAHRLLTRGLVWGALGLLVIHYLRHVYTPGKSGPPLPLPPLLLEMATPPPTWVRAIERNTLDRELGAILRRGETFLCCGTIPDTPPRASLPFGLGGIPVTDCGAPDHASLSPDFLLESAWYGRGAFILPSNRQIKSLIGTLLPFLHTRFHTHARPRRILWLVWALDTPMPENWLALLSLYSESLRLGILHVGAPGVARRIPSPPGADAPDTPKPAARASSTRRPPRSGSKERASSSTPEASPSRDRVSASTQSASKKRPSTTAKQSGSSPVSPSKEATPPSQIAPAAAPAAAPRPSPPPPTPEAPLKDRVFATCPHCGRRMKLLGSMRGKRIRCPECKNPMRVPDR